MPGARPGNSGGRFECSAQAIRNWVRQAERDAGQRPEGLTSAEREELRREFKQPRLERDILKRATAWFARECQALPPSDSDS